MAEEPDSLIPMVSHEEDFTLLPFVCHSITNTSKHSQITSEKNAYQTVAKGVLCLLFSGVIICTNTLGVCLNL